MTNFEHPDLIVESYPFGQAPLDIIHKVARLFREVFCNSPYNQFAANQADPRTPLSFSDLVPAGCVASGSYQDLELLDAVELPKGIFRWMDPTEFELRFAAKAPQSYIAIGRHPLTQDLKAFIVCRVMTLRELFYTEEFRNPVYYSGRELTPALRSSANFYNRMSHHFGLTPDDLIFYTVGMGVHPSTRGSNFIFNGMNAIADQMQPCHASLPSLAEVAAGGAGRILSEAVHRRVIHGILQNDHAIIHAPTVQYVIDHYRKGERHVGNLVKDLIRSRRKGLRPHCSDHPNVALRATPNKGTGVFASADIQKGELIAEFIGETYLAPLESDLPDIMADRCIQTGPSTYVFAENRLAEKINHSCEPNCGIRERTKIVAIKPIKTGDEISWDYRMSENSDWILENCLCGAERCAGRILGYDSLPEHIRQEYLQQGAISSWLLDAE